MRMWMVNPQILCDKHLLGEHYECHMFVGTILKGTKLHGYIENGLLEVHNLQGRHDQLAKEMESRGMKHLSPLPYFVPFHAGFIPRRKACNELLSRCQLCNKLARGK